jgi:hypothetical protein
MRCPQYLQVEAREYWKRHANRLQAAKLLTDADTESFALLCEIWGLIRSTDPNESSSAALRYIGLVKQYFATGKQFGMFAEDRKLSGIEIEEVVQDESGGSRGRPRQLGGGVRQAGPDVLRGQLGEVGEQLIDGHPTGEVLQHVPDGDSHPADARLAAPFARLDGDQVCVVHSRSLPACRRGVNE